VRKNARQDAVEPPQMTLCHGGGASWSTSRSTSKSVASSPKETRSAEELISACHVAQVGNICAPFLRLAYVTAPTLSDDASASRQEVADLELASSMRSKEYLWCLFWCLVGMLPLFFFGIPALFRGEMLDMPHTLGIISFIVVYGAVGLTTVGVEEHICLSAKTREVRIDRKPFLRALETTTIEFDAIANVTTEAHLYGKQNEHSAYRPVLCIGAGMQIPLTTGFYEFPKDDEEAHRRIKRIRDVLRAYLAVHRKLR